MNMHEGGDRSLLNSSAQPGVAVWLQKVSKTYRLYANRRQMVLDRLGFYRLMSWLEPSFREFVALDGIDLTIRKGERVGIIGRNGAGKTTLLKLIIGNFMPTGGRVEIHGTVQALMQTGLGFHPDFTGYENIKGALVYNGLSGDELEAAVEDIVEFVELGEFLHQPLQTYSLGMGTRLQFAVATAIKPDILVIDEVLGAGDGYFAGKSAHRMRQLTSNCTLLLVSHSLAQVLQFCDRVVWMDQGTIRMDGEALSVVRAYEEHIEHLAYSLKRTPLLSTGTDAQQARDYPTANWQKDQMMTLLVDHLPNNAVSRWPGEVGLKVCTVNILGVDSQPVNVVRSGQLLTIEIQVAAERTDEFYCRFAVLFMTLEGIGVCRILSHIYHWHLAAGEIYSVHLNLDPHLFAAGDFIFSVAAFKHYDPNDPATAVRYDLLSRSFRFKVVAPHGSDPGLFHHPAKWSQGQKVNRGESDAL
jgi:lipopolysaccharide transport system ATP-binding protein